MSEEFNCIFTSTENNMLVAFPQKADYDLN